VVVVVTRRPFLAIMRRANAIPQFNL
jgi:hypothetical protein